MTHYLKQELYQKISLESELFDFIQEAALDGLWYWDLTQPEHEWMNPKFWTLLGFDPATKQHLSSEWQDLIDPEDLERVKINLEQHLADSNYPFDQIVRYRHRLGHSIWVRCRGLAVRDEQGMPNRMLGAHTDVTELMLQRQELEEIHKTLQNSEAKFRRLFELSPVGIAMNDYHTGEYIDFNAATNEPAGYTREEFRRLNYWDVTPKEYADQEAKQLESMEATGHYGPYQKEYIRKDGSRYPVLLNGFKTTTPEGREVIWSIIQDITEQKNAEIVLQKAKQEAEEANRAKSEFLANMSHEIRTPMNGIIGMSELGLNEADPQKMRHQLTRVNQSGRLLLGIINDILDFSKIEAGKLELDPHPFQLEQTRDELNSLFTGMARAKDLAFNTVIQTKNLGLSCLVADSHRLRQVLINLIGNAIKFTESGHVNFIIRQLKTTEDNLVWVKFSVEDSGVGMSEQQQARLFNAFTQADTSITRKHGGSGLGLVISERLVRLLGGDDIRIQSQPNQGSSFSFSVPMQLCNAKQQAQFSIQAKRTEQVQLSGRVLLVEDNEINQEVAGEILRQLGMTVEFAGNGQIAVEKVQQQTFDVILMDIQMPVMDGYQACQAIRQFNSTIPIIALTAAAMVEDKNKALEAGMNDHLAKPLNSDDLYRVLSEHLPTQPKTQTKPKPVLLIVCQNKQQLKTLAQQAQTDYQVKVANNSEQAMKLIKTGKINQAWLLGDLAQDQVLIDQLKTEQILLNGDKLE